MEVLDGSTVEAWSGCPFAAAAIEDGKCRVLPEIVAVGTEVHDALSKTLQDYVSTGGVLTISELRRNLADWLLKSRPDVQPQAMAAIKASAWAWCNFIATIKPVARIVCFDGGEPVGCSGQLSTTFPDHNVILTSELDLLYDGVADEVMCEVDYKSGWKKHDAQSVLESGQFQRHAILVFENFPNCMALDCQVWDTRINRRTYRVTFVREKLTEYRARVIAALELRAKTRPNPPTFPTLERCSICSAACICPVADQPLKDIISDPQGFVRSMAAVQSRLYAMEKIATAYVDQYGTIDAGDCKFGRDAPKTFRKASAKLYQDDEQDGE